MTEPERDGTADKAPLSARALVALINDPRTVDADEHAIDALLRSTLRDVPDLGRQLFHADPDTIFDHWWERYADICGGPPKAEIPTHQIEVKIRAKYNSDQLDRYRAKAPHSRCFVVMPAHRAASPGADPNDPTGKGHAEMLSWGNTSHLDWTIVTWEAIGAWLTNWLGPHAPTSINDDPAYRLVAEIARVYGPCPS